MALTFEVMRLARIFLIAIPSTYLGRSQRLFLDKLALEPPYQASLKEEARQLLPRFLIPPVMGAHVFAITEQLLPQNRNLPSLIVSGGCLGFGMFLFALGYSPRRTPGNLPNEIMASAVFGYFIESMTNILSFF